MKDKFQILRDFANSNNKPDKTIYQFIKEVLDRNSAYAKENKKLKDNLNKLKEFIVESNKTLCWTNNYDDILGKMEELQGSDSNE